MINKQSLWFLTLFSLILVLSVYYITMPNELLLTNNSNYIKNVDNDKSSKEVGKVTIKESESLTALRVSLDDERLNTVKELQTVLTNTKSTIEDKNNAYEQIKYISQIKGKEEDLENKIKTEIKKDVFIKIDNNQIRVIVSSDKHDIKLANDIMRSIQSEFDSKMYISVKFQK
jgi:stage III sporulation protein AH